MEIQKTAKNISYTLTSNIVNMLISVISVTILPKFLSVTEYGYYQLFLFYAAYVGIMHFGWNDGIYLRNGGKYFEDLDHCQLFYQFWMQFGLQFILALGGSILSVLFIRDSVKYKIIFIVMLYMIVSNLRVMLLYILQVTNKIKEYSVTNVSGRIFFILVISIIVIIRPTYWGIIWADFFGRFISLLVGCFYCKKIIIYQGYKNKIDFEDIRQNVFSGCKLMISNLAAQLILGVIKFGIENNWSIEVFAKVSLAITASNMLMIFVNAVGLVMYPEICRTSKKIIQFNYLLIQHFLGIISIISLLFYYPAKYILNIWLPEYSVSITMMSMIFPATIFEAKMSVLTSNILKRFRDENMLLWGNTITFIFASILTYIAAFRLQNLNAAILLIPILLSARSFFFDLYLYFKYNFGNIYELYEEIIIVFIFIISNQFLSTQYTFCVYILAILVYIALQYNNLKRLFFCLRKLLLIKQKN